MIPPIAAPFEPHALACSFRKPPDHRRADRLLACAIEHGFSPFCVQFGLVADDLEADDALLERRIVQIGHARLNGVVEPLQP
nr:hypothetical protein [Brucella anthropi]